jgi:hypothetical protein
MTYISQEEAVPLLRQVKEATVIADWNADLLFRLDDGRFLAYWAASDYGPDYWQLEPASR